MHSMELQQETDSMEHMLDLRNAYQRHLACVLACSRSLLLCDAWHYDAERLEAVLAISDHIRSAAEGMQAIQGELGGLERRMGIR